MSSCLVSTVLLSGCSWLFQWSFWLGRRTGGSRQTKIHYLPFSCLHFFHIVINHSSGLEPWVGILLALLPSVWLVTFSRSLGIFSVKTAMCWAPTCLYGQDGNAFGRFCPCSKALSFLGVVCESSSIYVPLWASTTEGTESLRLLGPLILQQFLYLQIRPSNRAGSGTVRLWLWKVAP